MRENPLIVTEAIACHLLLGFVVFMTNPRRPINRNFLLITIILGGWVAGIEFSFIDGLRGAVSSGVRAAAKFNHLSQGGLECARTPLLSMDHASAVVRCLLR